MARKLLLSKLTSNPEIVSSADDFILVTVIKLTNSTHFHVRDECGDIIPVVLAQKQAQQKIEIGSLLRLSSISFRQRTLIDGSGEGDILKASTIWKQELFVHSISFISQVLFSNQRSFIASMEKSQQKLVSIDSLSPILGRREPATLMGIVKTIFPTMKLKTKIGNEVTKQTILFVDATGSLFISFWEDDIKNISLFQECKTVLLLENVVISTWKGRTCGSVSLDTIININPQIHIAQELLSVCESNGMLRKAIHVNPQDVTSKFSAFQISKLLENPSSNTFGKMVGQLTSLPLWGRCCINLCLKCRKRVQHGQNVCPICPGYISTEIYAFLRISLIDHSSELSNVSLFGKIAETFIGVSAMELSEMSSEKKEQIQQSMLWKRYVLTFSISEGRFKALECIPFVYHFPMI